METKIYYRDHQRNKDLLYALESYIEDVLDNKIPDGITEYRKYLNDHIVHDIKPILTYTYTELNDSEFPDYPSEQFLISLSDTAMKLDNTDFHSIMDLVVSAWNHNVGDAERYYDDENKKYKYKFITGGWSGNEEILDALFSNVTVSSLLEVYNEAGGFYIISFILGEDEKDD